MSDVGSALWGLFEPLGPWWGLAFIFLLFFIDAILIPTLPELFVVLVFLAQDHGSSGEWLAAYGMLMLLTIVISEIVGVMTLYTVIRKARLGRYREMICRGVNKYCNFLLVPDERMILINRIAPVLPFLGGFIALSSWNLRRSVAYVAVGGTLKYGAILLMSGFFLTYFSQGTAQTVTLIMILSILAFSFIASYLRRRKVENADRAA